MRMAAWRTSPRRPISAHARTKRAWIPSSFSEGNGPMNSAPAKEHLNWSQLRQAVDVTGPSTAMTAITIRTVRATRRVSMPDGDVAKAHRAMTEKAVNGAAASPGPMDPPRMSTTNSHPHRARIAAPSRNLVTLTGFRQPSLTANTPMKAVTTAKRK